MAKDDRVVERDIVRPDEFGALEIILVVRLLGPDFFFGVLLGVSPGAIIKVDGIPIVRYRNTFNARILRVAINGAPGEFFRLPRGVGDGTVAELQDKSGVTDIRVGVFHSSLRISIVLGHHRDRHRISGQNIDRDDVVRDEGDRVHGDQLAIDVENERVVAVDVGFDGIGDGGLPNFAAARRLSPSWHAQTQRKTEPQGTSYDLSHKLLLNLDRSIAGVMKRVCKEI